MEDNLAQPPDSRPEKSQPRRFVYRSVQPDAQRGHPMRRSTDIPRPLQASAGQLCPQPLLLKMRVYMKVN